MILATRGVTRVFQLGSPERMVSARFWVVRFQGENHLVFAQVDEEVFEVVGDLEVVGGEKLAGFFYEGREGKHADVGFEKTSKGFQDAAGQVGVVFLVENFP